jgi:hypothetical protein
MFVRAIVVSVKVIGIIGLALGAFWPLKGVKFINTYLAVVGLVL